MRGTVDKPLVYNLGCNVFKIYLENLNIINVDLNPQFEPDVVADVRDLPFKDNSADLVWASHLVEHFQHSEAVELLKEWRRVVKPGGQVQIVTPDVEWCIDLYYKGQMGWDDLRDRIHCQGQHKNILRQDDQLKLLRRAGFEDVRPLDLRACPLLIYPDPRNPVPEPGQCGAVGIK